MLASNLLVKLDTRIITKIKPYQRHTLPTKVSGIFVDHIVKHMKTSLLQIVLSLPFYYANVNKIYIILKLIDYSFRKTWYKIFKFATAEEIDVPSIG